MTTPTFKEEAVATGEALIKMASTDNSVEKYLIEETGREMVKLAKALNDDVTAEEVNAMATLEKRAGPSSDIIRSVLRMAPGIEAAQRAAGTGVVGLTLGLGALAAMKAANKIGELRDYSKYRDALNTAYSGNDMLAAIPEEGIRDIGESIYRFAPKASQDPNLLKNILNTYAASGGVNGGLEGPTIRMLTEIEDRLTKRTQSNVNGLKI